MQARMFSQILLISKQKQGRIQLVNQQQMMAQKSRNI